MLKVHRELLTALNALTIPSGAEVMSFMVFRKPSFIICFHLVINGFQSSKNFLYAIFKRTNALTMVNAPVKESPLKDAAIPERNSLIFDPIFFTRSHNFCKISANFSKPGATNFSFTIARKFLMPSMPRPR